LFIGIIYSIKQQQNISRKKDIGMEFEHYKKYRDATSPHGEEQFAWPLYGAGLENLGKGGKPIKQEAPSYKDDELLMRIDAVSLCYTDVKEIDAGESHPRLTGRNLKERPIIPGHEISFTVVGIGKDLQKEYKIGERFTIQPDVWIDGKSRPFCFDLDGGYRQYAKIGKEVLRGDAGNYLISVPDTMTYAAVAITEPWACVEAAYRMSYRTQIVNNGKLWIIGCDKTRSNYEIDDLLSGNNLPSEITYSDIPEDLLTIIKNIAGKNDIKLAEKTIAEIEKSDEKFDDILVLDCSSDIITTAAIHLNKKGTIAICKADQDENPVKVDLGRLHYDSIYFVGSDDLNLANAYQKTKARVNLKTGGITWIVGAGGPMGRMHLQRAIEAKNGPKLILATELTQGRIESMRQFFGPLAQQNSKELIIINPQTEEKQYAEVMQRIMDAGGVDDIEVMVAAAPVVSESMKFSAKNGVVNLFAGLKRGVTAEVNSWLIYGPQQIRFVGHSGSALDDQKAVVERVVAKELNPVLSVAAVGGFKQISDGILAMKNWKYPGKIVIYPHIADYPITALNEFEEKDPEIFSLLGTGNSWTKAAETLFLDKELSNE
jgi:threonine dehydrogenase-like Zn-dependent dehydrogenase